ncbi:nuclear protein localization protein 4 homolog isoform X2 [Dysidea avara]
MLYLEAVMSSGGSSTNVAAAAANVTLDEVDNVLLDKDEKIYRMMNPQLCRHGPQGKCLNCAPLEPWDPQYLDSRDPPIKHLSFHSYLRKLTSGVDKGKFVCLEDITCKVKDSCTDHPPWPQGICSKCQPSAITLARQTYRHVDNVMFEDGAIVDRFIQAWRKSGKQRLGYLYGKYVEYEDVPLGIRAVVTAIYEPAQTGDKYSVQLEEDPLSDAVSLVAGYLGLTKVGWIFTDLEAKKRTSNVHHKRSVETYVLSAEECIMSAHFQNIHHNPCHLATNGSFGSKFVTVVVSGDENHQVHLRGYQVSNQCMALVRDNCLLPCMDTPSLGYIKESSGLQFVPDVFYTVKSDYGNTVTKLARPLPLEYLIVEVTTTTPLEPCPTLPGGHGNKFPIEHRAALGEVQDFNSLTQYLQQQTHEAFLPAVSDLHFLLFLHVNKIVPLQAHLPSLCKAIANQDAVAAFEWSQLDQWKNVEMLTKATLPSPGSNPAPGQLFPTNSANEEQWVCSQCTLKNNPTNQVCEACQLPRTQ